MNVEQTIEQLKSWVGVQLKVDVDGLDWQPLKGDAGFRQYFRVKNVEDGRSDNSSCTSSKIAVYAPPATEDSKAFVEIDQHLCAHAVQCPEVYATDFKRGFLLLEDLGDATLFDHRNNDNLEHFYARALRELVKIQSAPRAAFIPVYSEEKLLEEMHLLTDWFIPKLLKVSLSNLEQDMLERIFLMIIKAVVTQPSAIVHRDYHSQNLLVDSRGRIGVVDFQDAVIGPITYDLVSLLRDCYFKWPQEKVREVAIGYKNNLVKHGLIQDVEDSNFMRWFDWMGMQRHMKVLGIFARLWLRDGKNKYLNDLPLVLEYVLNIAKQYEEFLPLNQFFEERILPALADQDWSSSHYQEWKLL